MLSYNDVNLKNSIMYQKVPSSSLLSPTSCQLSIVGKQTKAENATNLFKTIKNCS